MSIKLAAVCCTNIIELTIRKQVVQIFIIQ
jgi:hypothetical protein